MHRIDQLEQHAVCRGPHPACRIGRVFGVDHRPVACRVGTEVDVDMVQRAGVVLVVRRRVEHRVQVDRIDAEVLKVGQALQDAGEVTAEAAAGDVGQRPIGVR
jgi:hypothetical protein